MISTITTNVKLLAIYDEKKIDMRREMVDSIN